MRSKSAWSTEWPGYTEKSCLRKNKKVKTQGYSLYFGWGGSDSKSSTVDGLRLCLWQVSGLIGWSLRVGHFSCLVPLSDPGLLRQFILSHCSRGQEIRERRLAALQAWLAGQIFPGRQSPTPQGPAPSSNGRPSRRLRPSRLPVARVRLLSSLRAPAQGWRPF